MTLDELLQKLRSNYTGARNTVAFALQGAPGDPAHGLHEDWMYGAAKTLGSKTGDPDMTRFILGLLGSGNEMAAGGLELLRGKPFASERGYDLGDISANERGIERALAELIRQGAFSKESFAPR